MSKRDSIPQSVRHAKPRRRLPTFPRTGGCLTPLCLYPSRLSGNALQLPCNVQLTDHCCDYGALPSSRQLLCRRKRPEDAAQCSTPSES